MCNSKFVIRGMTTLRKIFAYLLEIVVLLLFYLAIDYLFDIFGFAEDISWRSTFLGFVVGSGGIIIVDAINNRRKGSDRSAEIIRGCRRIIVMTTLMFGGLVFFEWLIMHTPGEEFVFETRKWLPLALAVGIGNYIYERREQKRVEKEENRLVLATECASMEEAKSVGDMLEKEGVSAMIVERESPIYIKGGDALFQVQVCYKDLKRAEQIIRG
jgi:hypothetical protein